jgi:hypothetical protein
MKLARIGTVAIAVLAISSVAFAQAPKPDFSGMWTPEAAAAPATPPATPPAGEGARGGGRGMAGPMTVKQTADTLTIERTRGENKVVSVYKLDGTESENKMMGRGGEVVTKSTVKWEGDKLVISTTQAGQDGTPVTRAQTWSLEGGNLVIESPGRDGAVNKTVYKKTT